MEKDFDSIEEVEALEQSSEKEQQESLNAATEDESQGELELQSNDEAELSASEDNLDTELESGEEGLSELNAVASNEDNESAQDMSEGAEPSEELNDTELASFESADIEDEEFVEDDRVMSIVESILFATDKPQTVNTIKQAFQGTNVKIKHIKRALENLMIDYASAQRGFTLEEVSGGYQLRTKVDNMEFLKRMLKPKAFRLSGPALEVLSIVAYKQPCIKMNIDEIRGVESGHLLRALMEKGLVNFAGKSELPGKPMLYQTTRKFLEVFGLRNINELPSLSEIDELIPEGIGDEEEEKPQLNEITDELSNDAGQSYSEHEEELEKITDKLSQISTSSDFFEQEKARQKQKRDAERAQDIEDKLALDEEVDKKDIKWLERYKKAQEELALELEQQQAESSNEQSAPQDEIDQALSSDENLSEEVIAQTTETTDSETHMELSPQEDNTQNTEATDTEAVVEFSAEDVEADKNENQNSDPLEVESHAELNVQAENNEPSTEDDDLISELEKAIASGNQAQSGDEVQSLMDDSEDNASDEDSKDKDLNL
ncbi:MAG: SMC-Scp complex subunit ScpB [Bdellovibrionales bacterium]|nr:SMC-Scp complex subunit ScpB [Bdellovibrionales bacterium]